MSAVFITGANAGLGLEIVRALLGSTKTYTIYLGSRSMSNAMNAIKTLERDVPSTKSTIKPVEIDVASDQSIQAAFSTISAETDRLDVIVNNAGESP
jgi:NAD(P)-dependent dehydrogenase (short-subunit alcohol dehydrogenase family)